MLFSQDERVVAAILGRHSALKKILSERSSKNERDLRSLKKRLNSYSSAKECVSDPFFIDLFIGEF
ncbi:hypothetical protein OROMI_033565 [Orobanche minor]